MCTHTWKTLINMSTASHLQAESLLPAAPSSLLVFAKRSRRLSSAATGPAMSQVRLSLRVDSRWRLQTIAEGV